MGSSSTGDKEERKIDTEDPRAGSSLSGSSNGDKRSGQISAGDTRASTAAGESNKEPIKVKATEEYTTSTDDWNVNDKYLLSNQRASWCQT